MCQIATYVRHSIHVQGLRGIFREIKKLIEICGKLQKNGSWQSAESKLALIYTLNNICVHTLENMY